ncbi:hypothetical protein ENTCAN_05198 [Enterobacter cancerogenus ATCC 35316]|nr:hypothetical protein ENTCAN_05198 [Enterobacter cancerogenus ATCC 35316]
MLCRVAQRNPATAASICRPGKAQPPPGFFVKKLRRKNAVNKQKFPINAVT